MIHIVFNEPDVKVLLQAVELDNSLQGEIVQIKDDYAVGPLKNIYVADGIEERRQWWRQVRSGSHFEADTENEEIDDYKTIAHIVGTLRRDENETVWIWAAQNKHDVCGYYWLLKYLQEFEGRVFILYLNNLPFINEKGNIFYPHCLSQIPAKEFLKAKKLARPITPGEYEIETEEWTKICNENKGVRLLEGGKKLTQADYDFYDTELKKYITSDWQKASKIIHHYLSKARHTTGDVYLLWRLKEMMAQSLFDVQEKVGNKKDFELKKLSTVEN